VISGRYEILDALGKGGMGVVYKARDIELDEIVALKVLRGDLTGSSDSAKRFRSEIKLARKVTHANVCRIHDYGREGHLTYIVMEFIAGTDLKEELRRHGGLEATAAIDIVLQVSHGLEAVHRQGIVHRDLKTPNIMRMADGTAKLMDFGIAKSASGSTSNATATGLIVGTPEYMSPEQARAETVDGRSDIYALGVVLFELLTGDLPFRGDTPVSTLYKHLQDPPPLQGPRAARLPSAVIPILRRALAKRRSDRYATVREFASALEGVTLSLPAGSPASERPTGAAASLTTQGDSSLEAIVVPTTPMPQPGPLQARHPSRPPERRDAPRRREPAGDRPSSDQLPGRVRLPPVQGGRPANRLSGPAVVLGVTVVGLASLFLASGPQTIQPEAPTSSPSAALPPASVDSHASRPLEPTAEAPAGHRGDESQPPPLASEPPGTAVRLTTHTATTSPERSASRPVRTDPAATTTPTTLPLATRPPSTTTPVRLPREAPPTLAAPAVTLRPIGTGTELGRLMIGVRPWAEVFVDGTLYGTTPLAPINLPVGEHTIRLVHPDYQPLQRKVRVAAGEATRLQVDLEKLGIPR
jgi:serine/threonine protein kinase